MDTPTGDAAAAVIRAHQRRALDPCCRCSPTLSSTHDDAVHWSPTHVAEQLERAGLLAVDLPAFDVDATGPVRAVEPPSDPRGTLNP